MAFAGEKLSSDSLLPGFEARASAQAPGI